MIEVKAPNAAPYMPRIQLFLAGSIEMGVAEDWQTKVTKALSNEDIVILNPRRDDWDSSWIQSIDNPQFFKQVNWELNGLEYADIVLFYFDPTTKSPITLMELGFLAGIGSCDVIVCCPEGFWRKGNVDVLCNRKSIAQVDTIDDLILVAMSIIRQLS